MERSDAEVGQAVELTDEELFASGKPVLKAQEVSDDEIIAGVAKGTVRRVVQPAKAGTWKMPEGKQAAAYQQMFENKVRSVAKKHGIDPDLFAALVWRESKFDPSATSHVGASGLTQLMPNTAKELGLKTERDRYNPDKNLDAGARYLAAQLKRFKGNVDHALAAYNGGPENVKKYGGVPPFPETKEYVKKIKEKLQAFQKQRSTK